MIILCDTCAIMMLIRLVPEMFIDPRFDCKTTRAVRDEVFKTAKFSKKYPWRTGFKNKIAAVSDVDLKGKMQTMVEQAINAKINTGTVNNKTKRCFDLSWEDRMLAAVSITNNWQLCSHDRDLVDFLEQEFDQNSIPPLGLYNKWLEEGLITYSVEHGNIMSDWKRCNERPQPSTEVSKFIILTGQNYQGT